MIDTVKTLLQAETASEADFREMVRRLGSPDRLSNMMFDEGVRVQYSDTARMHASIRVIDRLRLMTA
jgi:hypothetical protein